MFSRFAHSARNLYRRVSNSELSEAKTVPNSPSETPQVEFFESEMVTTRGGHDTNSPAVASATRSSQKRDIGEVSAPTAWGKRRKTVKGQDSSHEGEPQTSQEMTSTPAEEDADIGDSIAVQSSDASQPEPEQVPNAFHAASTPKTAAKMEPPLRPGSLSRTRREHRSSFTENITSEVMVNYLYQQQCSQLWVSDGSGELEGVLLREKKGKYIACPPQLTETRFGAACSKMDVNVAMTVNSRVINTFFQWSPEAVDVALMNGLRIQILPGINDLPKAQKNQFAALIATEMILVVWDDDPLQVQQRAKSIESNLMELVWRREQETDEDDPSHSRPPPDIVTPIAKSMAQDNVRLSPQVVIKVPSKGKITPNSADSEDERIGQDTTFYETRKKASTSTYATLATHQMDGNQLLQSSPEVQSASDVDISSEERSSPEIQSASDVQSDSDVSTDEKGVRLSHSSPKTMRSSSLSVTKERLPIRLSEEKLVKPLPKVETIIVADRKRVRLSSEDPPADTVAVLPQSREILSSTWEDDDSDDEAPEIVTKASAFETVQIRKLKEEKASQRQQETTRRKRQERDARLKAQAQSSKRSEARKRREVEDEQKTVADVSGRFQDEIQSEAISFSKDELPDLLPESLLASAMSHRRASPALQAKEVPTLSAEEQRRRKHIKFLDREGKPIKDVKKGGINVHVLEKRNVLLAPKADSSKRVREQWLKGREWNRRTKTPILPPMERRKIRGGFLRKSR
ncbi:hypothetical protein M501DRAFT_987112 [Patellaria atrata CBS 101060]|uniref:DUF7928 domain-containing protein n=1 Tax=Patellaria atrata CBS 101060 TaxID=1346257 RepID=A0A9P4VQT9_9PEZI|nr:hypothetical protein M501DRAFT_987112 [Patellaria atrata CBS 101060]